LPFSGIISPAPNQNFNVVNLAFREPYVESWNFAIQLSLPKNLVAEVAYVANHGVRMPVQWDLNAGLIPGAGAAGQPLFAKFGRTANTNLHFTGLDTHYNSLQVKLDKRFSGGFQLTTAYTFGKGPRMGQRNERACLLHQRAAQLRTHAVRPHAHLRAELHL
jgi:hypothetical protein